MMKKIIILGLLINYVLLCCPTFAKELILERGERVRLKFADTIATNTHKIGDQVDFIVGDDVCVGDAVLIKAGSRATGLVSEIFPKASFGRPAIMTVTLDYAIAIDGKKVPLYGSFTNTGLPEMPIRDVDAAVSHADQSKNGKTVSHNSFAIGGSVLGVMSVFVKGKDSYFPSGYLVIGRVDRDIAINTEDNIVPVSNRKK